MDAVPARAPEFDPRALAWFAVPLAILTIAGYLGDAFAPTLLDSAPLVLLWCSARLRNLVLVSPSVDVVPFFVVAVVRLVISDPLFFAFGRKYGDVATRWMEHKVGRSGMAPVLWMERMFRKAGWPMIAILPNNWICLFAGATGIAWTPFLIVNIAGTIVRVALVRMLGDAFADPILSFTDWVGDNRLWLTGITFGIVLITVWHAQRSGQDTIESPAELAEELAEVEAETETGTETSEQAREER
jgi:membrane protein DedA with SNARE-associated domain